MPLNFIMIASTRHVEIHRVRERFCQWGSVVELMSSVQLMTDLRVVVVAAWQ